MDDPDLAAIRKRDAAASSTLSEVEQDRRALLAYLDELEGIAEVTLAEVREMRELVRAKLSPKTNAAAPAEQQPARAQAKRRDNRNVSPAQWRLLEELSERNKNPHNEWRLPWRARPTGRRLVELGYAIEHEVGGGSYAAFCVFSITAAGRARLARRKKLDRHISGTIEP